MVAAINAASEAANKQARNDRLDLSHIRDLIVRDTA